MPPDDPPDEAAIAAKGRMLLWLGAALAKIGTQMLVEIEKCDRQQHFQKGNCFQHVSFIDTFQRSWQN